MNEPLTLPLQTFWSWLHDHPNCILRAGTPEALLYDDDDLHWQLAAEGETTLVAQLLRGKRLVGELIIEPEQVAYVQAEPGDAEGEVVFELMSETESERSTLWFFVLAHGFEDDPAPSGRSHPHVH